MAQDKYQIGRALVVIPSDTIDIISPSSAVISSTATDTSASALVDSTQNFLNTVHSGDVIRNTTNDTLSVVTGIVDSDTLQLSVDIMTSGDTYQLYKKTGPKGAVLYVGGTGNVAVETVGGDQVTFVGVVAGSWMPVKVNKVLATGTDATDILAQW